MPKVEEITLAVEGQADWAALESSIAKPVPDAVADVAPVKDPAASWAELPAMVGSLLAIALPEVKAFYTPEACQEWGEKMVPIAAEQGWDFDTVMGPKMALAVASVPFVVGPIVIIKARKAAALENRQSAAQVEQPGGSQKTIVFGSPDAAPSA